MANIIRVLPRTQLNSCSFLQFSEDCLYLNVYTPLHAKPTSTLPVMLFFHGGNYQFGGAGGVLYDGRFIASMGDVVTVVINFRLGKIIRYTNVIRLEGCD